MSVILQNQTTTVGSAVQTATGSVTLTASGTFAGADLVIEANGDNLGWVEVYRFSKPGMMAIDFPAGHKWRAGLSKISSKTMVSLSAVS